MKGQKVSPYDFAIAYLIQKWDEFISHHQNKEARGCVKIICKGKTKKGKDQTYIFSLVSEGVGKGQGLGERTGFPAAFGTLLIQHGKIKEKGVLPPEACVNIWEFMSLMKKALAVDDKTEAKKSPLIIQSIDEQGTMIKTQF